VSKNYYKLIADNRKARFDYTILETYTAGLVLKGTEVKSVRLGKVNLKDSFGRAENGEIWIHGMHISPYSRGNVHNLEPSRQRKALLNQGEIKKLIGKSTQKGFAIVVLKIYLSGNFIKVDLGLGKSKKLFSKKEKLKRKTVDREVARALKERQKG